MVGEDPFPPVVVILPFSHLAQFKLTHFTTITAPVLIAVIGGTGLSTLPDFHHAATLTPTTPWGPPASPINIFEHPSPTPGRPAVPIAFLARHGLHHQHAPHEVPSIANIAALRSLGVRTVIAFSAVGSLQPHM